MRNRALFTSAMMFVLAGATPSLAVDWNGFYVGIAAGVGSGSASAPSTMASGQRCLVNGNVYDIVGTGNNVTQWNYRLEGGGVPNGGGGGPLGYTFRRDNLDDLGLTVVTTGATATVGGFGGPFDIIYDIYSLATGATPKALQNLTLPEECDIWYAAADYLENGDRLYPVPVIPGEYTGSVGGEVVDGVPAGGGKTDIGGVVGGGRIGYMREFEGFVLGAEGEVFLSAIGDDEVGIGPFGMLTGRLGYKVEETPVMLFASLGAAIGQLRQGSERATGFGWSAGIGAEYQLDDSINLRAELRHVALRDGDTGMSANANLALVGVSFGF